METDGVTDVDISSLKDAVKAVLKFIPIIAIELVEMEFCFQPICD